MKNIPLVFLIIFVSCGQSKAPANKNDMITKGLEKEILQLNQNKELVLHKTVYLANLSEEQTTNNPDWQLEFEPLLAFEFSKIAAQGDLVIDTILDERTQRYLIRGMRLAPGKGYQNLYLVLDSNRQMIQMRLNKTTKNWFSSSENEFFWDKLGQELNVLKNTRHRFGEDIDLKVLSKWE